MAQKFFINKDMKGCTCVACMTKSGWELVLTLLTSLGSIDGIAYTTLIFVAQKLHEHPSNTKQYDRKSRHRRTIQQRRHERLDSTSYMTPVNNFRNAQHAAKLGSCTPNIRGTTELATDFVAKAAATFPTTILTRLCLNYDQKENGYDNASEQHDILATALASVWSLEHVCGVLNEFIES
ncbi:hypothetical protein BGX28_005750 [Mortierella sp. GBA30]|nr:hypothetical protein BGX28_005750 [Mortierella sp. GBA30]